MAKVKLGDFEVTLNGELPQVGSQLPNFLLADGDLKNVDLEHFKGKKLVLNIFPSMNTPVCSAAAVRFNALASSFKDTVVLCISRDLGFSHKQFCLNHNINDVIFLSDMRNEDFANEYGVLQTSFNIHGEPIVNNPSEAYSTLKRSGLKYLVLDNTYIHIHINKNVTRIICCNGRLRDYLLNKEQ